MGIPTFPHGSDVLLEWQCLDDSNALQDPATVQLQIDSPTASPVTYTYGTGSFISRKAQGVYQAVVRPDVAGDWVYTVITDDVNPALQKAQPGKFAVSEAEASP